jgi:hypothetical protein
MFEEGSKGPGSLRKDRLRKMKELWTRNHVYTRPLNVNGLGSYLGMRLHEKMFARFLQGVKPTENKKIRSFREGDEAGIQQLLNSYSNKLSLARYWDLEELQSYLRSPLLRGKVYYVEGEIRAFVCAVVLPYFARGKRVKIAIFENCHYENIPLLDQKRLVQSMLYDLKREGVVIAVDMAVGYNDSLPLRKNRFFKHPRKISVFVIPNFSDQDERFSDMKKSATVYLDSR